jgi:hypothetical protein
VSGVGYEDEFGYFRIYVCVYAMFEYGVLIS